MLNNDYPILEFDDDPKAFIEPGKTITPGPLGMLAHEAIKNGRSNGA